MGESLFRTIVSIIHEGINGTVKIQKLIKGPLITGSAAPDERLQISLHVYDIREYFSIKRVLKKGGKEAQKSFLGNSLEPPSASAPSSLG